MVVPFSGFNQIYTKGFRVYKGLTVLGVLGFGVLVPFLVFNQIYYIKDPKR